MNILIFLSRYSFGDCRRIKIAMQAVDFCGTIKIAMQAVDFCGCCTIKITVQAVDFSGCCIIKITVQAVDFSGCCTIKSAKKWTTPLQIQTDFYVHFCHLSQPFTRLMNQKITSRKIHIAENL